MVAAFAGVARATTVAATVLTVRQSVIEVQLRLVRMVGSKNRCPIFWAGRVLTSSRPEDIALLNGC
ncbi:hypothetical protein GCM10009764_13810 [Nocardia ninae]